jgi:ABC-type molybdate transport system substrate-binding protein
VAAPFFKCKATLTVFAAASLTDAFKEIRQSEANPADTNISFNFGGSQLLGNK